MTEPGRGLRFDVYERVQLPEGAEGIRELEEIELTPHIGVHHGSGQVVLRGHLLLSGLYAGENGDGLPRTLEHWIPVEISLPASRIGEPEAVAVDIENFDVDLLSPRMLNITGLLSLRGVEVEREPEPVPSWSEESYTFVNQPDAAEAAADVPDEEQPDESAEASASFRSGGSPQWDAPSPAYDGGAQSAAVPGWGAGAWDAAEAAEEDDAEAERRAWAEAGYPADPGDILPAAEPADAGAVFAGFAAAPPDSGGARTQPEADGSGLEADAEPLSAELPAAAQTSEPHADAAVWSAAVEAAEEAGGFPAAAFGPEGAEPEKKEMKIAVSAKKPEADGAAQENAGAAGLLTLIQPPAARESEPPPEPAAEEPPGEDVELRNLFLRTRGDERDFRKVKLCIVQREDTLEGIAGRYKVNPRELQLHNRLEAAELLEGQVLYIP